MLDRLALGFLNHLLDREEWALARLKPFAGQHLRVEFGGFERNFAIAGDGRFAPSGTSVSPEVTIRLPDDAAARLPANRDALFSAVRISGAADLAETLGFVARNLQWDIEADLAPLVGDIAAHRLARAGRHIVVAGGEQLRRLGDNIGEYLVYEARLVVRKEEGRGRQRDLAALDDSLARLERRVATLEHVAQQGQ